MHFSSLAFALGPKTIASRSISLDVARSNEIFTLARLDVEEEKLHSRANATGMCEEIRDISPAPDTNSLSLISARSKTEDAATLCRIFGFAIASRVGLSALREAAR